MSKNEKQKKQKKFIERRVKADGTTEVYMTQSPAKRPWGKIIIAILALSMVVVTVIGLIVVIIEYAG